MNYEPITQMTPAKFKRRLMMAVAAVIEPVAPGAAALNALDQAKRQRLGNAGAIVAAGFWAERQRARRQRRRASSAKAKRLARLILEEMTRSTIQLATTDGCQVLADWTEENVDSLEAILVRYVATANWRF